MSNAMQIVDVTAELPAVFELAKQLVPSGFLPDHIKTPGQAVAIILAGRELGMPPMRALRSLAMVKGKVVEAADSQLARFKGDGGKAVFVTLTEDEAELHLTHPNGDEHTERFDMADAKRAGLTANQTWSRYPKAMLRSRVITAGLKSVGWDGAVGNYDPDEAREIGPVPSVQPAAQPVIAMPKRLSELKQLTPEVMAESDALVAASREANGITDLDADDTLALLERSVAEVNAKAETYITEAQRKRLFGIFKGSGHTQAEVKEWLAEQYGVSSSKEIPATIYDLVCDRLANSDPLV